MSVQPITRTTFHHDLSRARQALVEAELTEDAAERGRLALLAALRVAAVVLALRTRPSARTSRPRNAWRLLAQVAPEYAEWAGYFHVLQHRTLQHRTRQNSRSVSARDADDLVRDAGEFCALVERRLDDVLWARHG